MGISLNHLENTQESRMMDPEQEPPMTEAHDTQRTDLTTEETVASVELVNSTQNGTTYTSHTMSTGVGKADKPLAERMEQKAGEEGTDISLRAGTGATSRH